MFIILAISSFTFFLRAVLECLFLLDVIVLDFELSRLSRLTPSVNTNESMHMIGSHLYAS